MDESERLVTGAEYGFEQKIYTWGARSIRSGHSPTIRISQWVLEDYPAFVILEHLDRLNVADAIRRRPDARLVLVQDRLSLVLEEASW